MSTKNKKQTDKTGIYVAIIGLIGTVIISLVSVYNTRTQLMLPVMLTQTAIIQTPGLLQPTLTNPPLSTVTTMPTSPSQPLFTITHVPTSANPSVFTETATVQTSNNLAPNPSFENGINQPLGWCFDLDSQQGEVLYLWDNQVSHSGTRSLSMSHFVPSTCSYDATKLCAGGYWKSERIPINRDHDYRISVWYLNTTKSDIMKVLVSMWGDDANPLGSAGLYTMEPNKQWRLHTYILRSSNIKESFPGVNEFQLEFLAHTDKPDNGSVWIDDISLVDLSQP